MAINPYEAANNPSAMSMSRRRALAFMTTNFALSGLGLFGVIRPAQAEITSITTAINRAGYIRALSQQIAKAYIQIALDVIPGKSNDIIIASQALIQRNIQQLKMTAAPDNNRQLDGLNSQSVALASLIAKTPSKANSLTVSLQADALLLEADRATRFYQGLSSSSQAKVINVAGRQRMLSQRTAKLYFLMQAGYDTKEIRSEMQNSRAEFNAALDMMTGLPITTPSIKGEMELAKQQWSAFQVSLDQKPNPAMMRNVATTSERLLEVMDSLTNQYDQALKDMLGKVDQNPATLTAMF